LPFKKTDNWRRWSRYMTLTNDGDIKHLMRDPDDRALLRDKRFLRVKDLNNDRHVPS
jgi:hypothetical protein